MPAWFPGPAWFLGLDSGQSGMRALIADAAGQVVGRAQFEGPSSPTDGATGRERFETALRVTVAGARESAGLAPQTIFRAACFGFSGDAGASGQSDDKDALARATVPAEQYLVTHDAWIALTGSTGGGPGIVTIAGTGSMAFGRNSRDAVARAGGWGFAFGDEGGAFDLARQALRAALRHEEGWGPPTALRSALLEATGSRDANDLLHRFYVHDISRARFASLAALIDPAAAAGDAIAQQLLTSAAQSLATIATSVRGQLFAENDPVDLRYSGGVFHSTLLLARFRMLVEMDGRTRLSPPLHPPAAGALLEAFRLAGVACTLRDAVI